MEESTRKALFFGMLVVGAVIIVALSYKAGQGRGAKDLCDSMGGFFTAQRQCFNYTVTKWIP